MSPPPARPESRVEKSPSRMSARDLPPDHATLPPDCAECVPALRKLGETQTGYKYASASIPRQTDYRGETPEDASSGAHIAEEYSARRPNPESSSRHRP